jgi:N-acetylmuramoyl-L-alanine amidase
VILITYTAATLYFEPYNKAVKAVVYKYGSSGNIVVEIQRRLKAWDYYDGSLDGKYGYGTYSAVKKFQTARGLTADGVAGNRTLTALGINAGQYSEGIAAAAQGGATRQYQTNNNDVTLLSRLINGEARGEPYEGQVAVGAVIMNRVRDSRFPNTVAGVIYQPGAFTAIVDGQIHAEIYPSSIRAARDALNGWDPSGGAVFYYNPAKTTNQWIWSRPLIKVIGSHRFCK